MLLVGNTQILILISAGLSRPLSPVKDIPLRVDQLSEQRHKVLSPVNPYRELKPATNLTLEPIPYVLV